MSAISIRLATPDDAEEIARLHVHSSLTAYRPILGEQYTGGDIAERIDLWRRMLLGDFSLALTPPEKTYVAVAADEHIAGFCAVGGCRDDDLPDHGEVYLLYVAPEYWRTGVGSRLFETGSCYLRERGFANLSLWVLEHNDRARSFYEKNGWQADVARKPSFSNPAMSQVRYRRQA